MEQEIATKSGQRCLEAKIEELDNSLPQLLDEWA